MTVVGLVGARGGSKSIPRKNLRDFEGHPLVAWSVAAGTLCPAIDLVVVSTDDEEIAAAGRRYGAEAPFLRPAELAQDDSTDLEYVRHAIDALSLERGDLVVLLRPTTPVRRPEVLAEAIAALAADEAATAVLSAHELPEPPPKMLRLEGDHLVPYIDDPRREAFNLPRQAFAPAYHHNGYVDVLRVSTVTETGTLFGERIRAFITDFVLELDRPDDFEFNAWLARRDAGELASRLAEVAG